MSWGSYYGSHWVAVGLKIIWGVDLHLRITLDLLSAKEPGDFVFNLGPYDGGMANFNPKQFWFGKLSFQGSYIKAKILIAQMILLNSPLNQVNESSVNSFPYMLFRCSLQLKYGKPKSYHIIGAIRKSQVDILFPKHKGGRRFTSNYIEFFIENISHSQEVLQFN